MPLTFDAELKRLNLASDAVNKTPNERALLNLFFAKIKQFDPDIIIVKIFYSTLKKLVFV